MVKPEAECFPPHPGALLWGNAMALIPDMKEGGAYLPGYECYDSFSSSFCSRGAGRTKRTRAGLFSWTSHKCRSVRRPSTLFLFPVPIPPLSLNMI